MKRAPLFGLTALLLVGLIAAGVYAMPFGPFGKTGFFGGNDSVRDAVESGDYSAYIDALEDAWESFMAEQTETRFEEMERKHKLMAEKRTEDKAGMMHRMQERNSGIEDACESGDLDGLLGLDLPVFGMLEIDEDNFGTFCELHEAMESRDLEKVKELSEELGIECPMKGFGPHNSVPGHGGLR